MPSGLLRHLSVSIHIMDYEQGEFLRFGVLGIPFPFVLNLAQWLHVSVGTFLYWIPGVLLTTDENASIVGPQGILDW